MLLLELGWVAHKTLVKHYAVGTDKAWEGRALGHEGTAVAKTETERERERTEVLLATVRNRLPLSPMPRQMEPRQGQRQRHFSLSLKQLTIVIQNEAKSAVSQCRALVSVGAKSANGQKKRSKLHVHLQEHAQKAKYTDTKGSSCQRVWLLHHIIFIHLAMNSLPALMRAWSGLTGCRASMGSSIIDEHATHDAVQSDHKCCTCMIIAHSSKSASSIRLRHRF